MSKNLRPSPYERGQMAARSRDSFGPPYAPGKSLQEFLRGLEEGRLELAHAALKAAYRRH